MLTDNEAEILKLLVELEPTISQRDLASKAGISVGLVNFLLHRLIKKGYVYTSNLNRRKMRYVLSTKGIKELTKLSYHFMIKVINQYKNLEFQIRKTLQTTLKSGYYDSIIIYGNGELKPIVNHCLQHHPQFKITKVEELKDLNQFHKSIILNLKEISLGKMNDNKVIDLVEMVGSKVC
ncbi:MAG: winged helix-turn-helix transcriptional regulator [Deltaproteobacteria bacterium]|nr:winged helix-turn-helix transcriptional regulator [Deltaproteobacteria bacterium]